ncbi:MAG: prolyl oligopeptidase family serine peptidase [Nitrospiraceae bacterium]
MPSPTCAAAGNWAEEWRLAGKGKNKQNGIDDFLACAEHLVQA